MPAAGAPAATTAGITTSATGGRVIPSSTRADGSTRREIRVRPGYRPPEDVEVYKNRTAEAWKNHGSGGVPGAEGLNGEVAAAAEPKTGAAAKNAKRREARKRAKAMGEAGPEDERDGADGGGKTEEAAAGEQAVEKTEAEKLLVEHERKAKKLRKKLREARDLQAKRDKGEGLLQEQFDKVIKIKELMRELEQLGFSEEHDGAPPADKA